MSDFEHVFLDRDGVLLRKLPEGEYLTKWSESEFAPGAPDAIRRLNAARKTVFVVTNQRGVALGRLSVQDLEVIHHNMLQELQAQGATIEAIYFCPHDDGQCVCRKPGVGLFHRAFAEHPAVNASNTVMVGDSWSDIEAGRRVGMRTILLRGDSRTRKAGFDIAEQAATA